MCVSLFAFPVFFFLARLLCLFVSDLSPDIRLALLDSVHDSAFTVPIARFCRCPLPLSHVLFFRLLLIGIFFDFSSSLLFSSFFSACACSRCGSTLRTATAASGSFACSRATKPSLTRTGKTWSVFSVLLVCFSFFQLVVALFARLPR